MRALESLEAHWSFPPNVTLLDAGTMGMTLLGHLRDADYVLVFDAVDGTGLEPGTVVTLAPQDLKASQVMHSLHDIRFADVLETAELSGHRPDADFVGVQVADMTEIRIGLTPRVEAALPTMVEAALALLSKRGIVATPKNPPAAPLTSAG